MLHPNEPTQAQTFARRFADGAAIEMLKVLEVVNKRARLITKIVLGASMPHQIVYVLALVIPWMDWTNASGILESVGLVLIAVAVPVGCDLLILSCIETVGAKAASTQSRWLSLALMFIPATASAYVNFDAPGPALVKVLAGFLVALVPMAQALRLVVPDFQKIDKMTTEVIASVTPVEDTSKQVKPKGPSKKERMLKIMASNPSIEPRELARRVGAHVNHAYTIQKEFQKRQQVTP